MNKDKILYKERPFIYMAIGLAAVFFSPQNMLTYVSAALMICAGIAIFYLRNSYQQKISDLEKKISDTNKRNNNDPRLNIK